LDGAGCNVEAAAEKFAGHAACEREEVPIRLAHKPCGATSFLRCQPSGAGAKEVPMGFKARAPEVQFVQAGREEGLRGRGEVTIFLHDTQDFRLRL
jgi:hypothetical protein